MFLDPKPIVVLRKVLFQLQFLFELDDFNRGERIRRLITMLDAIEQQWWRQDLERVREPEED